MKIYKIWFNFIIILSIKNGFIIIISCCMISNIQYERSDISEE
jgi:hypothetical protein